MIITTRLTLLEAIDHEIRHNSLFFLRGLVENWPLMNFLEVRENLICSDERISPVPKGQTCMACLQSSGAGQERWVKKFYSTIMHLHTVSRWYVSTLDFTS